MIANTLRAIKAKPSTIVATKSTFSNPRFVRKALIPLEPPKEPPTPAVEGCNSTTTTRMTDMIICAIGKNLIRSVWNIAGKVCHIEVKNANIIQNILIF